MGEKTGIAWTDHTFNPWIGCTKVSDGCKNCYAARDNKRYQWVGEWGKDYRLTADSNWAKPIEWAHNAVKAGVTRRVFCASLADVFDVKVPGEWRDRLWNLIEVTRGIGGLEWLILTKRPENIFGMMSPTVMPVNGNVRIGVTAENQEMFNKRVPILINTWSGKNFISVEPMLSNIEMVETAYSMKQIGGLKVEGLTWSGFARELDWVICGCESGPDARVCQPQWVMNLKNQCKDGHIPFFLKQLNVEGKLVHLPRLNGEQYIEYPE